MKKIRITSIYNTEYVSELQFNYPQESHNLEEVLT
jgi:hypothetical protein